MTILLYDEDLYKLRHLIENAFLIIFLYQVKPGILLIGDKRALWGHIALTCETLRYTVSEYD